MTVGSAESGLRIRSLERADRAWANAQLAEHFGSALIVSRGRTHDASKLPGLVAWLGGVRSGLLHYHLDQGACEVVSLVAVTRRQGIGTQLLHAAADLAREAGCSRLWLVTTNDNLAAKALYRSQGWTLAGVHAGAVTRSRQLKPEIPLRNVEGVAIEDEFEFEHDLLGG